MKHFIYIETEINHINIKYRYIHLNIHIFISRLNINSMLRWRKMERCISRIVDKRMNFSFRAKLSISLEIKRNAERYDSSNHFSWK